VPEPCPRCHGRGDRAALTSDGASQVYRERCDACGGRGVAQPARHSERYDPGPRRRIGGQYFDVDDVPPRGDRDY
jgi:cytochrome c5